MKPNPLILIVAVLCSLLALSDSASAQGTAFTYQGRLNTGGSPANGSYDIAFSLYATSAGGVAIAGPVTNSAVGVTNGLFTTTVGFSNVFTGASNWLAIAVSTNGANAFSALSPRQQLTPAPYAIYAENANSVGGTVSASQLTSIGNNHGGFDNFFVGPSGNATTGGYDNTASGFGALTSNTSGHDNTANGLNALAANQDGALNTAQGVQALSSNTSGANNTADGVAALTFNTIGSDNTADGYAALQSNTNGSFNTAIGALTLFRHGGGSNNIALGYQAGDNITAGNSNIDIGNEGLANDNNIIRIGSGQTATYLAGTLHASGDVKMTGGAGNSVYASGSTEDLRIVRGIVNLNGTIFNGAGFTVTKNGTGSYTINFNPAFSDVPAVTVTPSINAPQPNTATWNNGNPNSILIETWSGSTHADLWFTFIAIGGR